MRILAIIFGVLGIFIFINLLFSLLYLLSKSAGKGFYRWVTYNMDYLMVLSYPLFGVTQWVASSMYERFNWFLARIILVMYTILLVILLIVCFSFFGYFAGRVN